MKNKKKLEKNYVSKCCKSTFQICYKDDVEGEYYVCNKCLGDCDLIKIKLNCCDNNSRVIKQTKEITYFKCDICKREFSYGTEEEVNN